MAEVLTVKQAAERLQVTQETVREWLKKGRIKGVKLGHIWRIDAEALDHLLAGDEDRDDIAAAEEALADPQRIPHEQVRRELGL
jgi:excisionase family DNA binding protein